MEKLVYSLYGADGVEPQALATALAACGAQRIRINCRDASVAAGAPLIQKRAETLPDRVVQCWLPTSNPACREELDGAIGAACPRFHGWLVCESTIIANTAHPPSAGQRTQGFAQLAFLTLPEGLDWPEWRRRWRDGHTPVAINTQSNFEYVQNLVVEPLFDRCPPFVAIVEECFPIGALTEPLLFFDAPGDPERFKANLATMMASCERFIAPGTIDVFPTSQFDFGAGR